MSGGELAPFVAAAVRDKVVTDLYEELQAVKAKYEAVELTGKMGSPVYTSKPFSSGGYNNPMEWAINLRMAASKAAAADDATMNDDEKKDEMIMMDTTDDDEEYNEFPTFELRYLSQLEVRLGGMVRGIWHQSCRNGFACGRYRNGFAESWNFCFGMEAALYVTLDIEMDFETYSNLTERNASGQCLVESGDLPNFVLQMCHDNAKVRLRKVTFFTDKIESAMKTWNIPPPSMKNIATTTTNNSNKNSNDATIESWSGYELVSCDETQCN